MMRKNHQSKDGGQTMVEFALALPFILLLVFGIIEFGYLLFSFSSVNTASRDAARYGIAVGDGTVSGQRYYDCDGIVNAGLRVGQFAGMEAADFSIQYDNGPDKGDGTHLVMYADCPSLAAKGGKSDGINFGDRIVVTVNHNYTPIAALMGVPIQPFTMTSTSSRTIVKNANVGDGSSDGGGVGNGGGGGGGGNLDCHYLTVNHNAEGGAYPNISPSKSADCDGEGQYNPGEVVSIQALPKTGWSVGSWSGTDNDGVTSLQNYVTMPDGPHTVDLDYTNTSVDCYPLSLGITGASTGTGGVPTADPSALCAAPGEYADGETFNVYASPDEGNEVATWFGTNDNGSRSNTNTVTMPAAGHSVEVLYILTLECFTLSTNHSGGEGTDPIPSAPNCDGTKYSAGTIVSLTATADEGYQVSYWTGTDNDASTFTTNTVTMNGNKLVGVVYELETVLGPPVSVEIPNDPGEWNWNSSANQCEQIDLRWAVNSTWAPKVPVHYEVFRSGSSYGTVTGTYWNANQTVSLGNLITLGVRAVFPGGETSRMQEVTYACLVNELQPKGSLTK